MKVTSTPAQLNEGDEVTFTCTAQTNPGTIFPQIRKKDMNLSDNEYSYFHTFPSLQGSNPARQSCTLIKP